MRSLKKTIKDRHALFALILAWCLWLVTFRLQLINFWLALSLAVTVLSVLALRWGGKTLSVKDFNLRAFMMGIISALLLYGVFLLGKLLAAYFFAFATDQIAAVYKIRTQGKPLFIALVLLFITSPGEEIFWRGFLQRWAMAKYGRLQGFWLISLLYAAVHLITGNLMLVLGALASGLFWGFLYLNEENIAPLIISHALWTVAVFVFFPLI